MSSVQVPLFCECPASALEHADINSMDAIAKILIVAVFMNYQGQMIVWESGASAFF